LTWLDLIEVWVTARYPALTVAYREGADVFVSRRTLAPVARLAREITSAGGLTPPK
jgi:hypothetical protein